MFNVKCVLFFEGRKGIIKKKLCKGGKKRVGSGSEQ
jgi:hypothetical protein